MRLALFTDTYYPQVNGVALTLQKLVRHLEHRKITHQVFIPDVTDQDLFASNIHRFASLPFFLYPECRIAFPNYFSVRNSLQTFQPDLIHIATPFNIGLCGLYYGKKYKIPHIASYHTHFERYLEYYRLQAVSYWLWRYIRWFHHSCAMTLVPSEETKRHLRSHGIFRLGLWKRGVDCHLFTPAKNNGQIRKKYNINARLLCLYVGRMAPEKDLDILLEVMRRIPAPLSGDIHWLLVGDGPLLDKLRTQFPTNNVTFTGYLQGEALAEAYAAADLFVFPSSTETFGNVVLEAMASGTPAVGAQAGGVQEIIQHKVTGMLCPPRDAQSFADAVTAAIKDADLLKEMKQQARRYALTQSWEAIFDELLTCYERVIFLSKSPDDGNIDSA
ncbi:glycosyltransferase family 1 protein [Aneurinibacillus sp. Ricciae_BoGa-3]|uniref:glycosyltransferase family 4 protein n=1 Tax=Aneurinibacillus sp. Ricciae_BoGa-3 TaxID=3022697 RepID=UPI002340C2BA|nr:glycosyltransferase family 1 protein [Aneurinibacillus sp. Ricciae_BoGa-3]WCK54030.1 glycosyltransferase family 1 protein [Aneurinibacillus sp. Ricciae_BoGa-3]